jgi:hypothetical protein
MIIWERNEPKTKVLRNDIGNAMNQKKKVLRNYHWEHNEPKKKVSRNDHHWEHNEPKKKVLRNDHLGTQ